MNEEAEALALKHLVDEFKAANAAGATLRSKMRSWAESLKMLATVLEQPDSHPFRCAENSIQFARGGHAVGQVSIFIGEASIGPNELDWKDLLDTLRAFQKATEDKERTTKLLGDQGIPLSE